MVTKQSFSIPNAISLTTWSTPPRTILVLTDIPDPMGSSDSSSEIISSLLSKITSILRSLRSCLSKSLG